MAASEFDRIDVDLEYDGFEVAADRSQSDAWSLGCDISIEDIDATIQEISVNDIVLSGSIVKQEISVDIDSDMTNVMDLDVNVVVNGVSSSLVESQIVPYENILKITSLSPEAARETGYASSAYAAKLIYDLISAINLRVGKLESTNEQGGVINSEIEKRLKHLEDNQFFERYDDSTVKTKYNLFSDYEISAHGLNIGSGGSGEGGSGVSYLKDLWDVTIVSAANDDILVYNGTHWVNMPQSFIMPDLSVLENYLLKTDAAELYLLKDAANSFATKDSVQNVSNALVELSEEHGNRLNVLEKLLDWFHLTEDGESVYTEKNFFSTKEISAKGLNAGSEGGSGLISIENIIGVSLSNPVTGDVFVYNGTHWTNIPQSNLIPDLSGYATTDSVTTVSNKVVGIDERVKSVEDKIKSLETEKFFFKKEGIDDVIFTSYNLVSEKEISAHGLNYGSGEGASGMLKDLLDVKADSSSIGDLLVYDGTHWINTPQSAILPSIDTSVIATREWVNSNYASTSALSSGINEAKGYTDILRTYVKEQDQILSNSITEILDWFTLTDGVLLTKYNLASEKEVSAKGINASQGGGSSYNRLDSWSAYDNSKAGYVLSALLGYDLHSRVTTLENAEVDLSDYYTKSETDSQIASAIGAIDLSPYATKEALSTLEGQHDTLRSEFDALNALLNDDTAGVIDTWNEVVDFINEYSGSENLETILVRMQNDISSRLLTSTFDSWQADTYTPLANLVANHTTRLNRLDQSILSINTRLDGVDKTIEDHIAEFTAFRANFEISDDLILVRKNFASTKEVSAKGISQGSGGEGGGSSYPRLDTWEGYDSNKAGYVLSAGLGYGLKVAIDELKGYNLDSRVSAIENAGYTTKTYVDESFLNKNSGGFVYGLLTAVAGMRLTNTETNIGTLYFGATDGQTIANTDSSLLQITSPSIVLKGFTSVDGKLQATDTITALNDMSVTKGLSVGGWGTFRSGLSVEGGNLVTKYDISVNSGHQIFWTDANSVKHGITYDESAGAFKLDGKFITTGSGASLTWGEISGKPSVLDFGGTSSQFLKADGSLDGTSYLPLSGGTITGNIVLLDNKFIRYNVSNGDALLGVLDNEVLVGTTIHPLRLRSNGTTTINGNTLYHTGNFNPADYLPKTGGTIEGALTISSPTWGEQLIINRTTAYTAPLIKFQSNGTTLGYLGMRTNEKLYYVPSRGGDGHDLLHNGNVGEYAPAITANQWATSAAFIGEVGTAYIAYRGGSDWSVTDNEWSNEYTLYHSGNFNPADYLPLSGGTIESEYSDALKIKRTGVAGAATIAFYNSDDGHVGSIGIGGSLSPNGKAPYYSDGSTVYPLIHQGNYSDIIGDYYLKTSGGTINGKLTVISNFTAPNIFFNTEDTVERIISPYSYYNYDLSYYDANYGKWRRLAFTDSNVASADYAANAGTLGGFSLSVGSNTPWGTIPMITRNGYMDVGRHFEFHYDNTTGSDFSTVLMCTGNHGNFVYLPSASGTLALTTDNVASATKLATARTIWGQSFDGTGNVSGNLYLENGHLYGTYTNEPIILQDSSGASFGYSNIKNELPTYVDGSTLVFRTDSYRHSMTINSSGNVGIGTTAPQYKLHVDGTGYFSGALTANGGLTVNGILTVGGASIHPTANNPYFQLYQNSKYWYWQADDNYAYIGGTSSKAIRIDQDGNTLIRGSLGVDALLTASNGLTVSKGISATDGIVSDWITAGTITANTSASIAALTVSGLSTLTGGIATNDIHGNGQSLYLGNASNNAYIKVREDMQGSSSMWSIPRDGRATFTSLTTPTLSVTGSATIASVTIEAGTATLRNLTVNTLATLKQLVVGTDGMSCNGPANFNDFIYSSSIAPDEDNYYVIGTPSKRWFKVNSYDLDLIGTATVNTIKIRSGQSIQFEDSDGSVHTLQYDSTKQAFVFDGNVNATGEMSAKTLNA